jgi:hypothetical protein
MRIAYDFEKLSHSMNIDYFSELWNIFIRDRVEDLVGVIVSSPQSLKGRSRLFNVSSRKKEYRIVTCI